MVKLTERGFNQLTNVLQFQVSPCAQARARFLDSIHRGMWTSKLSKGCSERIKPDLTTSSLDGVRDKTSQLLSRNMKAGLPHSRICSQNIMHKMPPFCFPFFVSRMLCKKILRLKITIVVQTYFLKSCCHSNQDKSRVSRRENRLLTMTFLTQKYKCWLKTYLQGSVFSDGEIINKGIQSSVTNTDNKSC